jgi:hypothetical protein
MILTNLKLHYILAMCPKGGGGGGANLLPNYQIAGVLQIGLEEGL